ncbi:MAG: SNF2 helicase associated domain-containing protein [Firmicutes bacterium]|nr:SNF2 helicase associated domain-containing protein [Bacillota bacterium]
MLTKTMLSREAGDTIYQRGRELYESGSVKELKLQNEDWVDTVHARVQGSGNLVYQVGLTYSWATDSIERYTCECAAYRNYDGMCKHCVAVALGYIDSCEDRSIAGLFRHEAGEKRETIRTPAFVKGRKNLPQTSPALAKLLRQSVLKRTLPITDTASYGRVLLIPELKRTEGETVLSFSIGTENGYKYVLKDVFAFVRALEQNESFPYGRKLTFVHTREAFAEESRGLVDFVRDWVESNRERYSRSYNRYSRSLYGYLSDYIYTSQLRELPLTDIQLEDFLNALGGRAFRGEIYEQTGRLWQETPEKLPRVLTVRGEAGGLNVSVSLGDACRGKRDVFYFLEGKIYRVSRQEESAVQDFLDCFRDVEAGRSLFVAERDAPAFCRDVLPSLEQTFTPDYISFNKEDYGVKEVSFQIYLDAPEKDYFTCKLYAVYGEERYDLFKNARLEADRDMVKELQAGQQVKRYFNEYDEKAGEMRIRDDDDMAYELLTRGIPEFQSLGEVFISEALKLVRVSPAPRPTVGVSLSGDLLELRMTAENLSMEQLQEILGRYNRKKKFFRLANGDFINMEGEAIGALLELKEGLDLSAGQIKSGRIQLPKYRALYLDAEAKDWIALGMERNREFKALIRNMKTVEDNDFELPASLEGVLREYQKKGFLWLRTLKHNGFGGILADDMGLGKTLQVIALLLSIAMEKEDKKDIDGRGNEAAGGNVGESGGGSRRPLALVVCPASLVYNWNSEINRFAPQLSVKMVAGSVPERQSILENCGAGDILITSYDLLKRDLEAYQSFVFAVQIIDEAQYIKNYNTQASRAVKEIKAGFKLALTGTPIENRLSELWSIFDYLMPGYLYSYTHFRDSYESPIVQDQDETARKRLQKLIRPFVLRRLKKDVLTDLPDKLEENVYARLEGEQQELYGAHVARLRLSLDEKSDEEFKSANKKSSRNL